jgi:hypothetical protein
MAYQHRNIAAGMCRVHSTAKAVEGTTACLRCLKKARKRNRATTGYKPRKIQREDRLKVDTSLLPKDIARKHKVSHATAINWKRRAGWRKVWLGPDQEVVAKGNEVLDA